jgi:hypothetical protein
MRRASIRGTALRSSGGIRCCRSRRRPPGTTPRDSFQEKAQPYVGWATKEYVVIDGSEHLPVRPLTLNAPFPCTRSGFFKMTFLVKAKPTTPFDQLFEHWLNVHVPNVTGVMHKVDGFRYVVSHSVDPANEPYAGMAELYFPDDSGLETLPRNDQARRHGTLGRRRGHAGAARPHRDDRNPVTVNPS